MSNPVLDRWALELQQFNIKFQHIQGKKNVVADAISQLRTLGLYQHNGNEDVPITKNKVKGMKTKPDPNFLMDKNSILRKVVKLKYTVEPTIVLPRKLTSLIILEFYNTKGHQCISCTVNMMRHYFWWVGMQRDIHQHINSCTLCIQFLSNRIYTQPMHLEIPSVPFAGCAMDCTGPLPMSSKGHRHTLMFICLLTSYLITVPLKTKMADKVFMVYIKEILPKTSCPKFTLQDNDTELKMNN